MNNATLANTAAHLQHLLAEAELPNVALTEDDLLELQEQLEEAYYAGDDRW